jgi:hypothetical protein
MTAPGDAVDFAAAPASPAEQAVPQWKKNKTKGYYGEADAVEALRAAPRSPEDGACALPLPPAEPPADARGRGRACRAPHSRA